MFDDLVKATAPAFSGLFGVDIPVKLNGVAVKSIKGMVDQEEITDSPNEAEIGTWITTLLMDRADFESLDKSKTYTFVVNGENMKRRGPPRIDAAGQAKLFLTKA